MFSKILSKWTLFDSKSAYFPEVLWFFWFQIVKNHPKSHYFWYLHVPMQNDWVSGYSRTFFIHNMATDSWIQIIFCIFWMKNVHLLKILLNNPKNFTKWKRLYKLKHELKGNLGLRSFQGTPMSNKVNVNYCNFKHCLFFVAFWLKIKIKWFYIIKTIFMISK